MKTTTQIKWANIGTVSHGTLNTAHLLDRLGDELEWQIRRNGDYFSEPENFGERDKLNKLHGDSCDCFGDDMEILPDYELAAEDLLGEIQDALEAFAPPYCYFGAHPGDGSDFGYWPMDMEEIKEQVGFCSVKSLRDAERLGIDTDPEDSSFPPEDFTGEWLHINERGNCTLYVRENGKDREIWSIV